MHLHSIKLKGIGPYQKEVSVNFDALPGRLISITGENGAGKTTLLEAGYAGALYRVTPTRGTLKELATDRGSFVESVISNSHRYKILQKVDAQSGKGEASVVDENGKALTTSAKLPEFDAWAAKTFFSPEVFFTTIFTPQANAGFLGMKRNERKTILLQQLGIQRYELLSAKAREHARRVRTGEDAKGNKVEDRSLVDVEADIAALKKNQTPLDAAEAEFETAQIIATAAEGALTRLQSALAEAEAQLTDAKQQKSDYDRLVADRERWQTELDEAQTSLQELTTRRDNNQDVLNDRVAIEAAVIRGKELPGLIEKARKQADDLRAEKAKSVAEEARQNELITAAKRTAKELAERLTNIETRLGKQAAIETAKKDEKKARKVLADAEAKLNEAIAEVERLNSLALSSAEDRAKNLRTGHEKIIELNHAGGHHVTKVSEECIKADDEALHLGATLPGQKKTATTAKKAAEASVKTARSTVQSIESTLALEADLQLAQQEKAEVTKRAAQVESEIELHNQLKTKASEQVASLQTQVDDAERAHQLLTTEKEDVDKKAALATPLATAEARVAELTPQIDTLEKRIERLSADLAKPLDVEPTVPDITAEKSAVTTAESKNREAAKALTLAEQKLTTARETSQQLLALETERAQFNQELAEWLRLTEDFGKDGLQALEIDAAGPELSETINDLLRTCIGPRWTVSVETTRMTADNKKQLEGCDVIVTDNEAHSIASGESLSGGQKVIIGEAISLALTMLSCRRSGIVGATLVRDESGAALSPYYAPKYMSMLRRAAEKMDARFLFVSHNPECQELADAQVHVNADGTLTIKS